MSRDTRRAAVAFQVRLSAVSVGGFYGSKVWHSTSKYRRTIWQYNHKFKNEKKCQTPHLYEDVIKLAFLEAFNSLLDNKDEILEGYKEIIDALTDTSELDKESAKLLSECEVVAELLRKCVEENACSALDQERYQKRYTSLAERYETAKNGLGKIDDKRLERNAKSESIGIFIKELEQRDIFMDEFDEELWIATVDAVVVHSEHETTFTFRDGHGTGLEHIRKQRYPQSWFECWLCGGFQLSGDYKKLVLVSFFGKS